MTPAERLGAGIAALGLALPDGGEAILLRFMELLRKWNRVYNLTAIDSEAAMVVQHLLDSLSVLPYLSEVPALVDLGSGAGLPGIPIAVARPATVVTLVEAVQKKCAFQQQAKIELGLANIRVNYGRVEDMAAGGGYPAVISRAFADLAEYARLAGRLLAPGGRLYAMKGGLPAKEIAALPPPWRVVEQRPLGVPGLAAQRHLIVMERP